MSAIDSRQIPEYPRSMIIRKHILTQTKFEIGIKSAENIHMNGHKGIDPKGLSSNMRYFPRISQNSLKIPLKFRANTQIQSLTNAYLLIKMK